MTHANGLAQYLRQGSCGGQNIKQVMTPPKRHIIQTRQPAATVPPPPPRPAPLLLMLQSSPPDPPAGDGGVVEHKAGQVDEDLGMRWDSEAGERVPAPQHIWLRPAIKVAAHPLRIQAATGRLPASHSPHCLTSRKKDPTAVAMVSSRHTAAMSWKRATDQRLMRKRSSHHIRKRTCHEGLGMGREGESEGAGKEARGGPVVVL